MTGEKRYSMVNKRSEFPSGKVFKANIVFLLTCSFLKTFFGKAHFVEKGPLLKYVNFFQLRATCENTIAHFLSNLYFKNDGC